MTRRPTTLPGLVLALVSGEETRVDTVNACVVAALTVFLLIEVYILVRTGSFDSQGYLLVSSGLIGIMAGAKRVRDGLPGRQPVGDPADKGER